MSLHICACAALSSLRVATASVWTLLGLYIGVLAVPSFRRISSTGSFLALAAAISTTALAMLFAEPLKASLAEAIGFYGDALPWTHAESESSAVAYRNPFAQYTLRVPAHWTQRPGPMEGTTEFVLAGGRADGIALRMRPTCDLAQQPLPVMVADLLRHGLLLQRRCGHWRGMNTCLLMEPQAGQAPAKWQWLAHDAQHDIMIRLMFELSSDTPEGDIFQVLNSVRPASDGLTVMGCPNPLEWAEFPL